MRPFGCVLRPRSRAGFDTAPIIVTQDTSFYPNELSRILRLAPYEYDALIRSVGKSAQLDLNSAQRWINEYRLSQRRERRRQEEEAQAERHRERRRLATEAEAAEWAEYFQRQAEADSGELETEQCYQRHRQR